MATFYANSITGNDANAGTSWALAKKTLAGAQSAATAGDTICCHGVFYEALTANKALTWRNVGSFIIDGAAKTLSGPVISAVTSWIGVVFRKCAARGLYLTSNSNLYVADCTFDDCGFGLQDGVASTPVRILERCLFTNNSVAGIRFESAAYAMFHSCIFANNAISSSYAHSGAVIDFCKCVFRDTIYHNTLLASNIGQYTNDNVYDFSGGRKCVIDGVDKTTLASYLASLTTPREIRSIDRDWSGDVGDFANNLVRPNPSSYLLTATATGGPVGLTLPAVTVSNNRNASLWTGGVFSGTEIDGSGYLVLSAGQTSGYWRSDIIDFGASINAKSLEISVAGEDATNYLDYDTGDSPGYFNARVRGSNTSFLKTDASPSWVTVPRRAEIGAYMSNALRYWQVELTLRGP